MCPLFHRSETVLMSRFLSYTLSLTLTLTLAGFSSRANSQTKTAAIAASGGIAGQITIKGKPKAGIVVVLQKSNSGQIEAPVLKATSDSTGAYRITGVPAGSYRVAPVAPSLVVSDLTYRRLGKAVVVGESESIEGIDFSLTPGAVITGKVTLEDGKPVIEERVMVLPADDTSPRASFSLGNPAFQTDDRGVYRVYGLAPGKYKVAVGENDQAGSVTRRPSYKRTFYSDISGRGEAKIIELQEGGEARDIDITLAATLPGYAVSGVILDGESNEPLANIRFGIQRISNEHSSSISGALSTASGAFRLENLSAGKYGAFILSQPTSDLRSEVVTFEIVDHDVSGLTITSAKGATISGTLQLEGNPDNATLSKLPRLRLLAQVKMENLHGHLGNWSVLSQDGTFRIGGLHPGTVNFWLDSQDRSLARTFQISRIERNGIAQTQGIEIKAGEQVSGVKIFLTSGTGAVRGVVKYGDGPLPASLRILVQLSRASGFNPQMYEADSRGHFLIEGLTGGTYEMEIVAFAQQSRQPPQRVKQSIMVTDGAVTEVVVPLESGSGDTRRP